MIVREEVKARRFVNLLNNYISGVSRDKSSLNKSLEETVKSIGGVFLV